MKIEMTKQTKLALAAVRILSALTDDHESCYFCEAERGKPHDLDMPCGELEAAVPEKLKSLI